VIELTKISCQIVIAKIQYVSTIRNEHASGTLQLMITNTALLFQYFTSPSVKEMVPTIFHDIRQSCILLNSASLMICKITRPLKLGSGCSEEAFVRKTGDFLNAFILRELKCITRCCKYCVRSESITDFGPDVTFLWKRVLESSGLVAQCTVEVCLMHRLLYSWERVSGTC
jgi:hypothetical protein